MVSPCSLRLTTGTLLTAVLLLGFIHTAHSQVDVHGQMRLGGTHSSLQGPHWSSGYVAVAGRESIHGLTGGFGVVVEGQGWFSGEADMLITQKGTVETMWNDQGQTWEMRYRSTYIETPLLAHLHPRSLGTVIPYLQAGLAPAIHISSSSSNNSDNLDPMEDAPFQTMDLGLVVGAGARMDLFGTNVSADLRYVRGITDARQRRGLQTDRAKNRCFVLSAGIWF